MESAKQEQHATHVQGLIKPGLLDRFFKLTEHRTSIKTELLAGLTTFVTMAYIIFVNPNIMADAGIDHGAAASSSAMPPAAKPAVISRLTAMPMMKPAKKVKGTTDSDILIQIFCQTSFSFLRSGPCVAFTHDGIPSFLI